MLSSNDLAQITGLYTYFSESVVDAVIKVALEHREANFPKKIILDGVFLDRSARKKLIDMFKDNGLKDFSCIYMDITAEENIERSRFARALYSETLSLECYEGLESPEKEEGFKDVLYVRPDWRSSLTSEE